MRIGKKILKVTIMIIFLVIIVLIVCYCNHRIKLSNEAKLVDPIGELVEVNGHQMSVYTEGEGELTLVFLSGWGTCSPILDFKSLYSILSEDYKIAVVEKFGYGFSDIVDEERDIHTVLSETREALKQAKIEGPYVLCPHSMSGIESLYWAQQYPDEVAAIIGLDMAIPEAYAEYKISKPMVRLLQFAAAVGITRFIPGVSESDAIKYGTLTEEEKEIYRAIFYRRSATKTMINEVNEIKRSSEKVGKTGVPEVPILMFSSNGTGTGWNEGSWRTYQKNFIQQVDQGELIELDCGHYIHDAKYKEIADEIKIFLNKLTDH